LVVLDVTVLDKKGRPVVSGLTKDDFIITEDKKPQRIFSFEAPDVHQMAANAGDENANGKAPVTIFVLDLLNSSFQDFAFIRYSVRKYLAAQPAQLNSPAALMVIGNDSLEMLQGYTRNKADLLYALNHLPPALPYKEMSRSFFAERFGQSIDALQQIALQNKGIPGRKNVVWVGHGGPGINLGALAGSVVVQLKQYVHDTTNMLVDARISLFVIYPGLKIHGRDMSISAFDAGADIGNSDPFAGDINFGVFVNETGGNLFYNRNDVDAEIKRSQQLGSQYYTLTYQPAGGDDNGRFRRIRVTLRDPNLHVVTKAGYYAPDKNAPVDAREQAIIDIAGAAHSTIPFTALDLKVSAAARHPDTRTVELTLLAKGTNLNWQTADNGTSTANIILAAVSLSGNKDILASNVQKVTLGGATQDPTHLAEMVTRVQITVRVPRKTQSVRVVMGTEEGGRLGAADLDRKTIDAAPATPTPAPPPPAPPPQ
jgi:VWFA-related protein